MPKSNPSKSTRGLYQALQEQYEGIPVVFPTNHEQHSFNVKMERFKVETDEVTMQGDDFPYIRSALIDEAVERGDIEYKPKAFFADDATLTIDGEEFPIEDGTVTIER